MPHKWDLINEAFFIGYLFTGPVFYWSILGSAYLLHGDTQNDETMEASQPLFHHYRHEKILLHNCIIL